MLLRDIQLPQTLKASIEAKQQAEQEALAMNFRLQKEKQEAERKRIEAAGIRDFQQIVAQGISPQLLEWKGIEATETACEEPEREGGRDWESEEWAAPDSWAITSIPRHGRWLRNIAVTDCSRFETWRASLRRRPGTH